MTTPVIQVVGEKYQTKLRRHPDGVLVMSVTRLSDSKFKVFNEEHSPALLAMVCELGRLKTERDELASRIAEIERRVIEKLEEGNAV